MCLFVDDGTIHWLWSIEGGAGFMGKHVWFDTYWVCGAWHIQVCRCYNIASLRLMYKLSLDLLIL